MWDSFSLSDTSLYLVSGWGMYLKPFPCSFPVVCAFIFSHLGLDLLHGTRHVPLTQPSASHVRVFASGNQSPF